MVQINLIPRFEMELKDVSQLGREMDFKVFKDTVENNGEVKAIVAKVQNDNYTRKRHGRINRIRKYLWC